MTDGTKTLVLTEAQVFNLLACLEHVTSDGAGFRTSIIRDDLRLLMGDISRQTGVGLEELRHVDVSAAAAALRAKKTSGVSASIDPSVVATCSHVTSFASRDRCVVCGAQVAA